MTKHFICFPYSSGNSSMINGSQLFYALWPAKISFVTKLEKKKTKKREN